MGELQLHCAPPDFLSKLVALIDIIRFPLRETASVVLASAAKQEIRVRYGRDDKGRGVALVGVVSGMGRNRSPFQPSEPRGSRPARQPLVRATDFSPGERVSTRSTFRK
jgi:hypothetical protein